MRMTLADHLEELRRRLGISLLVLLAAMGVCMTQAERIIAWLAVPAQAWLPYFAYFTPTEPLFAYLKVGGLAGLAVAMPVILWQVWTFVRSGLTPRERSAGGVFVWWETAQFLAGAAFAYYLLLPLALNVLLRIGEHFLKPMISIDRYLSFVTTLILWCGLLFELPVLLVLLVRVGIVTPEWLRQQRPYAILVIVIIAAIATPTTDPITLCLMAVPLVFLYQLAIWVSRLALRDQRPSHHRRRAQ